VTRSTRREKHLIASFKKLREWKRSRGLKRPRGRRKERVLGKKGDKRGLRGKNPKTVIMTRRRTKTMASAVEVDLRVLAAAVVATALDRIVPPQVSALEEVGQVHPTRQDHSLHRHIQATVAEGGVDLVAHGGGGEVPAQALVAAVCPLAHLLFLPVLARGHVLIGGIRVKRDHHPQSVSVEKPPRNHQMGAVRK
jgi:hypothetical protein